MIRTRRLTLIAFPAALILAALTLVAAEPPPFRFDAPPGPQFSEAEKQTRRDKGAGVVPMVRKVFESGAESVMIPPGDYRFGKEGWGRDGVIYPLEFSDLRRDDAHPFTIDATGATFWFDLPDDQAPACYFCVGFKGCRNILFKANGTFCAPLYALQAGGVHLKYKQLSPATAAGRCWVTMGDTKLLDTIRDTGLLRVGDGLSCVYTVTSSLELVRSAKLTMEGIREENNQHL